MINQPLVQAELEWRRPGDGGRRAGPPAGREYLAIAAWLDGTWTGDWSLSGNPDLWSVRISILKRLDQYRALVTVEFMRPETAMQAFVPGKALLILEGRRAVGVATALGTERPGSEMVDTD